jgi:Bifunctional DNA primase/polymerase, N-terminal
VDVVAHPTVRLLRRARVRRGRRALWQRPRPVLRRAALRYADAGWPVVPGTFARTASAGAHPCEQVACLARGVHPAVAEWASAATLDPVRIARWWGRVAYEIVLPTGRAFDAVEVHADLGAAVRPLLVGPGGRPAVPIAVTPCGRWYLLVRPGEPLRPELAGQVVLHGAGSWVLAPPSSFPTGPVRWLVHPRAVNWEPADARDVQDALATFVCRRTR